MAQRLAEGVAHPVALMGRAQVQAARRRAAAHGTAHFAAPDAVAHVGVGGVMDARLAQVGDVLEVLVDHAVSVFQAQRDVGHVVQLVAGQAVDLQTMLAQRVADGLVAGGGVLGHLVRADHHPLDAHLLQKAHALHVQLDSAALIPVDGALHLGAHLDARAAVDIAGDGLHRDRHSGSLLFVCSVVRALHPPVYPNYGTQSPKWQYVFPIDFPRRAFYTVM